MLGRNLKAQWVDAASQTARQTLKTQRGLTLRAGGLQAGQMDVGHAASPLAVVHVVPQSHAALTRHELDPRRHVRAQLLGINLRKVAVNLACPVRPLAGVDGQQIAFKAADGDKALTPVAHRGGIDADVMVSG